MTFTFALVSFGLITMAAITFEILYTYATQGFGFGFSSNRPDVEKSNLGLRIERAYKNQIESAAYIIPILVVAALTDLAGPYVGLATMLIVIGRASFIVLYYSGIPFIRILGFVMASFSTLYLGILLIMSNAI